MTVALSAAQNRAADSTRVCSTLRRSNVDRLITLRTSAVRGFLSSDSRNSLSSRVFSMAMTACAAKFCSNAKLLLGERAHFLPVDMDSANQFIFLKHRHYDDAACSGKFDHSHNAGVTFLISGLLEVVGNVNQLFRCGYAC